MGEVIDFQKYKDSGELPPKKTKMFGIILGPDKHPYMLVASSDNSLELVPFGTTEESTATDNARQFCVNFEKEVGDGPLILFMDDISYMEGVEIE